MEDAADFADALAMLSKQKLTTPGLFTLVGTKNEERVVVERAPKRHALRWGRPGEPLITTNNYHLLDVPPSARDDWELTRTSCGRYCRLCDLISRTSVGQPVADEQLLYWLSDDDVRQEITAQHVLIRPAIGEMKMFVPRYLLN
jgi:isopenicillin-N N-acyltransferase like protein